jgi:hypothetical protein
MRWGARPGTTLRCALHACLSALDAGAGAPSCAAAAAPAGGGVQGTQVHRRQARSASHEGGVPEAVVVLTPALPCNACPQDQDTEQREGDVKVEEADS